MKRDFMMSMGGAVRSLHEQQQQIPLRQALQVVKQRVIAANGLDPEQAGDLAIASHRWAVNGFPTIVPSHKLTASLMCTNVSSDELSNAILPFDGFCIQVPDKIVSDREHLIWVTSFFGDDELVKLSPIRAIFEVPFGDTCYFGMSPADNLSDYNDEVSFDMFEHGGDQVVGVVPASSSDRAAYLFRKLIIGVCLEMSNYRQSPVSSSKTSASKRSKIPRDTSVFRLARPVLVDVRASVRDYVEGRVGHKPTVQTLVRGHWKAQRFGANLTDRKLIHIEPYWRGPEEAPVAVRPHLMVNS